ncbi:MAG: hypothetical protein C4538_09635 [Nitrospiraceae bacterium]|nr:MAG: hypothetical protein C4538_09635 [Nitrospiraceae bacterium]
MSFEGMLLIYKYQKSFLAQRVALRRYFYDRQKAFYIFVSETLHILQRNIFSPIKLILKICRIEILRRLPFVRQCVPTIGAEFCLNMRGSEDKPS